MRILLIFLLCASMMTFTCAEDKVADDQIRYISGKVSSADWVGSKISVRLYEPSRDSHSEMVFMVSRQTKFLRGTDAIDFGDIEQGDTIEVEYYRDPQGVPVAVSIMEENPALE